MRIGNNSKKVPIEKSKQIILILILSANPTIITQRVITIIFKGFNNNRNNDNKNKESSNKSNSNDINNNDL